MTETALVQEAVERAWSVYLATHRDVDFADERRCLLSRHLQERLRAGENDAEELTCSGLAYLNRAPPDGW